MKKDKFQPIVMPCTKEQYGSLLPILKKHNIHLMCESDRRHNDKYIVNDFTFTNNRVGLVTYIVIRRELYSKFYKRFNRKIFLASLGIVESQSETIK